MGALTNLLRGEGCSDRVLLGLLKHVVHVPVHYRRLPCAPAPQSTGGTPPRRRGRGAGASGPPTHALLAQQDDLDLDPAHAGGRQPNLRGCGSTMLAQRGAGERPRPPHLAMASAAAGRPVRRARHSRRWARPRRGRDAMAAAQRVLEPGGLRPEREGLAWKPAYSPPSVILAALTSSHPTPPARTTGAPAARALASGLGWQAAASTSGALESTTAGSTRRVGLSTLGTKVQYRVSSCTRRSYEEREYRASPIRGGNRPLREVAPRLGCRSCTAFFCFFSFLFMATTASRRRGSSPGAVGGPVQSSATLLSAGGAVRDSRLACRWPAVGVGPGSRGRPA